MNHELTSYLRSLTTLLDLAFDTLILPIRAGHIGSSLVLPAVANHLCWEVCSALVLLMMFMSIAHGVGHKKLV